MTTGKQIRRVAVWLAIASATIFNCSTSRLLAQRATNSEAEQVESYLDKLGMDELRVVFLEQQLEKQVKPEDRKKYAVRLAELYTQQLVAPSLSYEHSLSWQLKAQQLIQVYPDLDDPVLRIAIFHARYQSIYHDFEIWWQAGNLPSQRQSLELSLRELIRDLLKLNRQMESRRRELVIEQEISSQRDNLTDLKLARVDNVLLHTQYLAGWASYFRSIVQPENAKEWLTMAESYFRGFLQIEPEKSLIEVSQKWFDFGNGWVSRGLIGLGLCKQAQRLTPASQRCFQLAASANDRLVDNLIDVWTVRGLVHNDQLDEAIAIVKSKSDMPEASATPAYWVAVIKNGSAVSRRAPVAGNKLIRAGLLGLVRHRQAVLIRELVGGLNIQLDGSDFLSLWISGFLAFEESERTDDRNRREEARIRLKQGLDLATTATNPSDVARCEFLLATIRFRDREFELAEPMFAMVVEVLKDTDRVVAAQAMWRRIQTLAELSRRDSGRANQAFAVMDQMLRMFPESPHVNQIEFEKLKLNIQNLPDDEAIKRLAKIGPDSPFRTAARYEMIQRQHRLWLDAVRRGRPDAIFLDTLLRWEAEYRQNETATTPRKLKMLLLVVDAQLRQESGDKTPVKQLLESAALLAESIQEAQEELYFEYRYYKFLYLQNSNNRTAVDEANWLVENAPGTRYERSALIYLAQQWEQQLAESGPDRDQLLTGLGIYKRLTRITGNQPEQISTSANARVATARFAELHSLLANWIEAEQIYSKLLVSFPNDQNYLAASARCKTKLGRFDLAKPIWRKLAVGLEAGTESWYEAKYELAVCVAKSSETDAAGLIRQTIQLSPQMPEPWRTRFLELQSTFDKE